MQVITFITLLFILTLQYICSSNGASKIGYLYAKSSSSIYKNYFKYITYLYIYKISRRNHYRKKCSILGLASISEP